MARGGAAGAGSARNSVALIEFRNVSVMRGARIALDRVSLRIDSGEHVAILGPNGSGKSTLIKTITRECYPRADDVSSVRIMGREVWNVFDLRGMLGIVTNDLMDTARRGVSCREMVLSGFFSSIGIWPHQTVTAAMQAKAEEALERMEVLRLAERGMDELSSGEARRVLIARALVHDPRALLLDEPTASLDLRALRDLRDAMRSLARSGIAILLVTHHLADIIPEISRVVLLKDGRVFRDGGKREILTVECLSELYGLDVELIERDGFYYSW